MSPAKQETASTLPGQRSQSGSENFSDGHRDGFGDNDHFGNRRNFSGCAGFDDSHGRLDMVASGSDYNGFDSDISS